MNARSITAVLPVDDLAAAVAEWTLVLGVEPTFVDGDRWAQFDVGGTRLALAGADRAGERAGALVKVDDIDEQVARLRRAGMRVDDPVEGPHEVRAVVHLAQGVTTIYASR